MKTSIFATAATLLAAFGTAHSQTQVIVYGRVDATAGRNIGSPDYVVQNGTGSRLGFQGSEDLGGGLSAFFKLEHRFGVDTGVQSNAQHFWQHSLVGLKGDFGKLWLGRDYAPAYWDAMLPADPFGNATIANFTTIVTGGITLLRNDDMVSYQAAVGGFAATAAISMARNAPPLADFPNRPVSFSATYTNGPLKLAYGHDNPGADRDRWQTLMGSYAFGAVTVRGLIGTGQHTSGSERQSMLVSLSAPVGTTSQVHAAYGRLKDDAAGTLSSRLGLGYYYSFSKRTLVYADVAHDTKAATSKTGFDLGLRHSF